MSIPTVEQAAAVLAEGARRNPGPWVSHSEHAGRAARAIAAAIDGLDPQAAQVFGMLHDIGRAAGVSRLRHVMDGYRAMTEAGWDAVGRICLTHSFPVPEMHYYAGANDCTGADAAFLAEFLAGTTYDDYDRLIQLCDALCLPNGFSLLEKRLVDVALRYGTNEHTVPKWRTWFAIKADFDARVGGNVYDLLPGIVENTFGNGDGPRRRGGRRGTEG
ncbi:MAG TPA: HD domain-containing protein [Phycisphaerae bacterium]|nr:HD domain-containing protein [Phycisphaerae bacterium]HUU22179.1 HD domain-containing protein [Phycisphaerae bacterium]